jgi:hypothetical protein
MYMQRMYAFAYGLCDSFGQPPVHPILQEHAVNGKGRFLNIKKLNVVYPQRGLNSKVAVDF